MTCSTTITAMIDGPMRNKKEKNNHYDTRTSWDTLILYAEITGGQLTYVCLCTMIDTIFWSGVLFCPLQANK